MKREEKEEKKSFQNVVDGTRKRVKKLTFLDFKKMFGSKQGPC